MKKNLFIDGCRASQACLQSWRTSMKSFSVVCFLLLLVQLPAWAQNRVSGTVTDTEGEPLAGVSVRLKNTSAGVSTDAEGKYTISVPDAAGTLVFTYIGFATQEI